MSSPRHGHFRHGSPPDVGAPHRALVPSLAGRVHAAAQYELALDPDGCPVAATLQEAAEAGAEMADDDERNRS